MIVHTFTCTKCKITVEDITTKIIHYCPKCKQPMRWNIQPIGCNQGDYHHVSDSLAINPNQIPEHRKKFPGVNVLPDGRVEFNSFKQHDNYLKKTGFTKVTQKIKPKKATVT